MNEVRLALRQMLRRPGWAALAIAVLGLSIGASTAVFALVDGVLFRPLAATEPARLVRIFAADEHNEWISNSSYPAFTDYRDRIGAFDKVAAYSGWTSLHVAVEGGTPMRTQGGMATGEFFPLLGATPQHGRLLGPADDGAPGANPVAVISDAYFRGHFSGDPSIVGRTVRVNGHRFTIVGVLPPGFRGADSGSNASMWVPMSMWREASPSFASMLGGGDPLATRDFSWLDVIARLAPGVAYEQAAAELAAFSKLRREEMPRGPENREPIARPMPASEAAVDPYRTEGAHRLSWLLLASVFAVLLIACLDVMGLLLVRREERRQELAVRLGVGARPWQLVRQLLIEGLVLCVFGAVVGIALANGLVAAVAKLAPGSFAIPVGYADAVLSPRVIGFTVALSLLACLAASLVPALGVGRLGVGAAIRAQSPGLVGTRLRSGAVLIAGQIAISFVLLCLATLLLRSLIGEARVAPGFEPRNAVVASIDLGLQGYDEPAGRRFQETLIDTLRATPGVESAALARSVPVWPGGMRSSIDVSGRNTPREAMPHADYSPVSPGYFATMKIPLVAGREFDAGDGAGAPPVAIVSQELARTMFPAGDALGGRLDVGGTRGIEIVGIAGDVALRSLREPRPVAFYRPAAQHYLAGTSIVARLQPGLSGDPVEVIRRAVASLDPGLPIYAARTLEQQLGTTLGEARLVTAALGAFSAIAVLLSLAGIYGLFAYLVRRRQREIGLRLALGANAPQIVAMVLRQGIGIVVAGLGLGLAGSLVAARGVEAMLYGIGSRDAASLAGAAAAIALVALLAVLVPARQAARTDPQQSLRSE